jgi:hypothetical protein
LVRNSFSIPESCARDFHKTPLVRPARFSVAPCTFASGSLLPIEPASPLPPGSVGDVLGGGIFWPAAAFKIAFSTRSSFFLCVFAARFSFGLL